MTELPPFQKDHDYLRDLRSCVASCQGLQTLVGLMLGRGARFVHVEGTTAHAVRWAAIVVQGEPDITVLRGVAAAVEKHLDAERVRLREEGLRG